MSRRWLVAKGYRFCDNSKCINYAGESGKRCTVRLDPATGEVHTTCSVCKRTSIFQCREWKELRACERCRHPRNVTVHRYMDGTEHAAPVCDACKLMQSVAMHRETADRLEAKALGIFLKRKKK